MLTGSCLCGDIRYEVDGELGPIGHCHCRTCQKSHAAPFATTARVDRDKFRWTRGADRVANFESTPATESSPGKKRFFCARCGAHLMAAWDNAPFVIVRVGSIDGDLGAKPLIHIWTSHKAPWFEITDGLPQYAEGKAK